MKSYKETVYALVEEMGSWAIDGDDPAPLRTTLRRLVLDGRLDCERDSLYSDVVIYRIADEPECETAPTPATRQAARHEAEARANERAENGKARQEANL